MTRVEGRISVMHSPAWLGPSWAIPDPTDGSLRVLEVADSGPETQPGKTEYNFR